MKFLSYIPVFLLCVFCTHAMDLPTLSLVSTMICDDYEEPKTNYFDQLPSELHSKIVKNIFDLAVYKDEDCKQHINLEKLEKYIPEMAILLGIKVADEFSQFQKICRYQIGFKKFVARQLFTLPRQERDVFMRVAYRSLLFEGDICADDYKIIVKTPKDIKEGLCIKVNYASPILMCIRNVSCFGLFFGVICNLVLLNIPIKYKLKIDRPLFGCAITMMLCLGSVNLCEILAGPKDGPNGYLKEVKL